MSFTRSGGVAPVFSFPIGVGTFTDAVLILTRGRRALVERQRHLIFPDLFFAP